MSDELNERRRSSDADGTTPPDRPSPEVPSAAEHFDVEVLAGFLDGPGEMPSDEYAAIEAHVATCQLCRDTLGELRAIVTAMAALPNLEPRRSFAVSPVMAGSPEPVREVASVRRQQREPVVLRQASAWHERQMRAVRWATVAAAILFVFVLSADIVSNRFVGTRVDDGPAAITMQSDGASGSTEAEMADEPDAPPAAAEDASADADAFRAAGAGPTATAAPAAAYGSDELVQESTPPGEQDLAMQQEETAGAEVGSAESSDRRAMSTPDHYWRLAQVGLALIIVWLLAAMIVLPRLHARERK